MVVFECAEENLPDYVTRRKIQKQVAKSAYEHFIIYTNAEKTTDIYQWVKSFLKDLPNRKMNAPEKSNACSEKIPYLNGGIFQKHQLEALHGENIDIPDKAFEQLFRFFEQYQWHLDDRPLRKTHRVERTRGS